MNSILENENMLGNKFDNENKLITLETLKKLNEELES